MEVLDLAAPPMLHSASWHVGDPAELAQVHHTRLREAMKLDRLKERIEERRHNKGSAIPFKWRVAIMAGCLAGMVGLVLGVAFIGGIPSIVVAAIVPNLFVGALIFLAKDYRRAPDPDRMSKSTLRALGLLDKSRSSAVYEALRNEGILDKRRRVDRVPERAELETALNDVLGPRRNPNLINKIHFTLEQYGRHAGIPRPQREGFGLRRRFSTGSGMEPESLDDARP